MNRFDVARASSGGERAFWDVPIYETASFVAVPSLGALVPGWMLIIPRRSVLNTRALDHSERDELRRLVGRMSADMSVFTGELFIFEHGSQNVGSVVGCGVDQAHIHLVPLPFDLLEAAVSFGDASIKWRAPLVTTDYFDLLPADAEYVNVWHPRSGAGLSGIMSTPQSQWVRRVIAGELGKDQAWDYKVHPNHANLETTVGTFRKLLI